MAEVLVLGADGFIGSHLVEKLIMEGHDVTALAMYNSFGTAGWLDTLTTKPTIVFGDIRDSGFVNSICKDMDIVYHLAALIGIPYSYVAPQSYIDTNVYGTLNVLEACKNKRVMITSTSEVYGSAQYTPMDENHPKNAQSPYAASKVAADALALSYHKSFGTPVTVVRPFNTYGPRQSMRAVIPQIIMQMLDGGTIKLGKTSTTRDFNYVEDTASQMIKIINSKNNIGKEVNICTGEETSIMRLFDIIKKEVRPNESVWVDQAEDRMRPDNSEVDRLIGTGIGEYNGCSMEKGLRKTIDWFKQNSHLYKHGYTI